MVMVGWRALWARLCRLVRSWVYEYVACPDCGLPLFQAEVPVGRCEECEALRLAAFVVRGRPEVSDEEMAMRLAGNRLGSHLPAVPGPRWSEPLGSPLGLQNLLQSVSNAPGAVVRVGRPGQVAWVETEEGKRLVLLS